MKNFLIIICLCILLPLSAVHDFTINGQDALTVSVSDSLHFEFEFESVGNSADFDFSVEILGQQIPLFSGNYLLFQDGGMLDETGLDGSFSGGFNNFIQLPESTTLIITLTDEEVSDAVEVQFVQLDTDFSISGNVLQEGTWIDLPVIGGLVYTIYNGGIEVLIELLENFDLETFLAFIASDHYILSDLTGFLGDYQIFIPEDIPNVTCITGVYSYLDLEGGFIPPDFQEVTVNGHLSDIDFMYLLPDGDFYGVVIDEDGDPIANAAFLMDNPNSVIPYVFASDELGNFAISLADGTYEYTVTALGYSVLTDEVTINGGDVYREIILEEIGGEPDGQFYGFVRNEQSEPVVNAEIMIIPITPAGDPQYVYTMADGSFGIALYNGTYSYMVSHAWYIGVTGEFEIAGADVYHEIVMLPVNENDNDVLYTNDLKAYPNPFNPTTSIEFYISQAGETTLNIYNLKGELVNTLLSADLEAGKYTVTWDGRDENKIKVASGIYFCCLKTGERLFTRRMILLK